jgi:hypothetical protein
LLGAQCRKRRWQAAATLADRRQACLADLLADGVKHLDQRGLAHEAADKRRIVGIRIECRGRAARDFTVAVVVTAPILAKRRLEVRLAALKRGDGAAACHSVCRCKITPSMHLGRITLAMPHASD